MKVEFKEEIKKLPNKDFNSQPNSYLLRFEDDTNMFFLPTNVNTAGGDYDIPQKGKVNISYGRFSQAGEGEMTGFNDTLIMVFNEVNSYEVKRGFRMTLTFKGPKGEVKFKKK